MPDPANRPTLLVAALGHRLHGLAAPAAAAVPWPWRPPAASNPRSGPAVRRGAGRHDAAGLLAAGDGELGAAAGDVADRGAVRGGLFRGFMQGRLQASLGSGP